MDKKKSNNKSKSTVNTRDIRSFFDLTSSNNLISSSSAESPVKKPSKPKFETNSKSQNSMPPKRKKVDYFESESEEEVVVKKKVKNGKSPKKRTIAKDDDFVPKKKSSKKNESFSSSDDDFVPISKKKSSKKSDAFSSDDDDDDFVEKVVKKSLKKASKNESASKKSTKSSTKKSSETTVKKTTKKSSSKATTKLKGKKPVSNNNKGKLVKPMDYESSDNEEHVESTMIKKADEPVVSGFEFRMPKNKTAGDSKKGMLWVDRHKPRKVGEIVGQQTPKCNANKLRNWLMDWDSNKDIKPKFGMKNDTGAGLKAALLSGIPGIGKTTTAQLVAKECGYEFVEFNASDTRNKKSMELYIRTLTANKSLSGFFQDEKHRTEMATKHLVIMDEVDGMSGNADRSGIKELIQCIKKMQIPIICICNDRNNMKIRNLANYCFDLKFSKIKTPQIVKLANDICTKEGVKVDPKMLEEIIEMSNRDIRQVIHYLSVFAIRTKTISNANFTKLIKNVTIGIFDSVHQIFTHDQYQAMSFNDRLNIFFGDYSLIPLMIYENYLIASPANSKNATETLEAACKSIDAMCIGDLLSTEVRTKQTWNLLPMQGVFSTVMPGHYMNGRIIEKIEFSSWLGKLSTTGKKERLVSELKQHMNLKVTGSKTCLNLDYILPLREKIIRPLIKSKNDGIETAVTTLAHYNLLKEDMDSIIELSLWQGEKNPYQAVDSKVKAALTREYNKMVNPFPYAYTGMYKKTGKQEKSSKKQEDDEEEQEIVEVPEETLIPEF